VKSAISPRFFLDVVLRCDKEEIELFAILARGLWLRRNDYVHGGTFTHPNQVVRDAKVALEEFHQSTLLVGSWERNSRLHVKKARNHLQKTWLRLIGTQP
jgi:hypothetical protein